MQTYDIGDVPRLSTVARNEAGSPADPTTVSFQMKTADGVETTYIYGANVQVVKDSTGTYHVDWTVTQKGTHHYRWSGTGAVVTADEGAFFVRESRF